MKNYRERLEKYRNYQLSPEDAQEFEQDLADAEHLLDDLLEKEEQAALENFAETQKSQELEEKIVRKKIRQRYLKMVALIVVVVSLVVGGGVYLIPKAIDNYYYNPLAGESLDKYGLNYEPSKLELYERIKNQVEISENPLLSTSISKTGTATYNFTQIYANEFQQTTSMFNYTITKNRLELKSISSQENQSYVYGSFLTENLNLSDSFYEGSGSTSPREKISQLPDSAWISVELTFNRAMGWSDIVDFVRSHQDKGIYFYSTAIDVPESTSLVYPLGVRLDQQENLGDYLMYQRDYNDDFRSTLYENYPNVLSNNGKVLLSRSEEEVTEYLTSNMQYLSDHYEDSLQSLEERNYPEPEEAEEGWVSVSQEQQAYLQNMIESLEDGAPNFPIIYAAIPKASYDEFVTTENFNYATLLDVSMFRW